MSLGPYLMFLEARLAAPTPHPCWAALLGAWISDHGDYYSGSFWVDHCREVTGINPAGASGLL